MKVTRIVVVGEQEYKGLLDLISTEGPGETSASVLQPNNC